MKTKLKTENMMPQNANENKNSKEKIEKRKEAKEIKTKEKKTATATARARACACVREEAASVGGNPSGLDAKSAAAAKREKDELIRENYRLLSAMCRARRCLRVWYVALRKHKEEIAALKREVETLKTENGELSKQLAALMLEAGELRKRNASLSGSVGSLCDLALALDAAVKRYQAKFPDGLPPEAETEGGAK